MIALLSLTAWAQSPATNGQLFHPSIDAEKTWWTHDAAKAPNGYVLARGVLHYANQPVVYQNRAGKLEGVVTDVLQLSAMGAFTVGPLRLGLDLPIYLYSDGIEGGETGLGDIAVDGKLTVLDPSSEVLGVALEGRLTLPTTTVKAALGDRGVGYELMAIVDKPFGDFLIAANIGTRGIPGADLNNFEWNDQFLGRIGVAYGDADKVGMSLDIGSNITYSGIVEGSTPAEAILGGWLRPGSSNIKLRAGVGTGITSGFGAPRYRVIAGVAWEPPRTKTRDTDGDGIIDSLDQCPELAEDFDQFEDSDGCAEATPVIVRVQDPDGRPIDGHWSLGSWSGDSGDRVAIEPGTYAGEVSAAGYESAATQITVAQGGEQSVVVKLTPVSTGVGVRVTVVDTDGTPIQSAKVEMDGQEGASQTKEPGPINLKVSAPGYRPVAKTIQLKEGDEQTIPIVLSKAKVEMTGDRIEIRDSVYFETSKDVIKAESHGLLNEVAELLQAHPELVKIRVEGHTDARGSAAYNLALSKKRAAAVRAYLIERGVAPERLESEGYGETRPLDTANNEAAWTKNRRVDFFVVERADE